MIGSIPNRGVWCIVQWAYDGRSAPDERVAELRQMCARALSVCPPSQVVVAVLEQDAPWWGRVLAEHPRANVLVQPFDRGSGVAVLLACMAIARREPEATVVLLTPSDERRMRVGPLLDHFRQRAPEISLAFESAERALGPPERSDVLDVLYPQLACVALEDLWPGHEARSASRREADRAAVGF